MISDNYYQMDIEILMDILYRRGESRSTFDLIVLYFEMREGKLCFGFQLINHIILSSGIIKKR